MRKIKIAQIGVGHDHARDVYVTLNKQSDIYDFVGYAAVPEDSGNLDRFSYRGFKDFYDESKMMTVEEILNYPGLDAVCIETEDRALTKYAAMAAEKGLNIHMDKPGGISGKDYDRLIDAVKEKGLVFHTGYMYRYNPAVIKAKEAVKEGKLGDIYAVEAQMNCFHTPDKREWLGNYPGGMLYFLGCHLVDLVYSIMGEPESVIPLSTPIGTDNVNASDFGMAVFKYKNGVSFVKSTAVEYGGFDRRQLVICGTKGTVEIKPLEKWCTGEKAADIFVPLVSYTREAYSEEWSTSDCGEETEVFGRYDAMFRAFASYVRKEKENPFGYEYERGLHKLLLKACGGEIL